MIERYIHSASHRECASDRSVEREGSRLTDGHACQRRIADPGSVDKVNSKSRAGSGGIIRLTRKLRGHGSLRETVRLAQRRDGRALRTPPWWRLSVSRRRSSVRSRKRALAQHADHRDLAGRGLAQATSHGVNAHALARYDASQTGSGTSAGVSLALNRGTTPEGPPDRAEAWPRLLDRVDLVRERLQGSQGRLDRGESGTLRRWSRGRMRRRRHGRELQRWRVVIA